MKTNVGVVIPHYNEPESILDRSVTAALASDLVTRVVIVDDGSAESGLNAARDVAEMHGSRVTLLERRHEGVGAAINAGIKALGTKFVATCACDDMFTEHKVDRCVEAISALGVDGVFHGAVEAVAEDGGGYKKHGVLSWSPANPVDQDMRRAVRRDNIVPPSTKVMRAEVAKRIAFPTAPRWAGDWFWNALLIHRSDFAYLDEYHTV